MTEPLDAKRMAYSNLPLSEVGSATSKEPDPQLRVVMSHGAMVQFGEPTAS